LNDFSDNQLTKFRAVYTVKVNLGMKGTIYREKLKTQIFGVHRPLIVPGSN